MKEKYEGTCHCGRVKFSATLDLAESIVCDCSICRMKGSIVNRVEPENFELKTSVDELSVYTFNKHIAKHYFCPTCGAFPFHRPRSYPDLWGINVRCLPEVDIGNVDPKPVFGSKLD